MGLKAKAKRAGRFVLSNLGRPVRVEQTLRGGSELLAGRCVLVTGGTSGIGLATAEACLRAGADVVVTSRSLSRAEEACARLGSHARPALLDLADAEGMACRLTRPTRLRPGPSTPS